MEAQVRPAARKTAPDEAVVREVAAFRARLLKEMSRVVVGQQRTVDLILTSLLSGGHTLLTGVPGLAKTLMIRSIGRLLDLKISRIQFTPDLMPSDIIGTEILEEERATGQPRAAHRPSERLPRSLVARWSRHSRRTPTTPTPWRDTCAS